MTEHDEELLLAIKAAIASLNETLKAADDAGIMVFCEEGRNRTIAPGIGGPPYFRLKYAYKPEYTVSEGMKVL